MATREVTLSRAGFPVCRPFPLTRKCESLCRCSSSFHSYLFLSRWDPNLLSMPGTSSLRYLNTGKFLLPIKHTVAGETVTRRKSALHAMFLCVDSRFICFLGRRNIELHVCVPEIKNYGGATEVPWRVAKTVYCVPVLEDSPIIFVLRSDAGVTDKRTLRTSSK